MPNETQNDCPYCDEVAGQKTYQNQVRMPSCGRVVSIDYCIHPIVAALNAAYIRTTASCCGHGASDGLIMLEDGRELILNKQDVLNYGSLMREMIEGSSIPEHRD